MPRHPTVDVPGIGPMDHAWDALGEWDLEVEIQRLGDVIAARLHFPTWRGAALEFEPWGAVAAQLPERVALERASRIRRTDAGGGALEWVFVAVPPAEWTVPVTVWPGALHLFAHPVHDPDTHLYRAVGRRSREYYRRKYPLVPR